MQFKLTTWDNADAFCFCPHFTCSRAWEFRQPPHVWVLENLCAASMPALLAYMSTKWLKTSTEVMVRFHTCHCIYPNNSKMMEASVLVQICILLSFDVNTSTNIQKAKCGLGSRHNQTLSNSCILILILFGVAGDTCLASRSVRQQYLDNHSAQSSLSAVTYLC